MKKIIMLAAGAALGLWGCASSSKGLAAAEDHPTEKEIAQESRKGAPTVYDGEATGGAGFTVTTPEGVTWTPEVAPGNTVTRTQKDSRRYIEPSVINGKSVVIDEGKTPPEEASQLEEKPEKTSRK